MNTKNLFAMAAMTLVTALSTNALALQDQLDPNEKLEIFADLLVTDRTTPEVKASLELLKYKGGNVYGIGSFACDYINRSLRAQCELIIVEKHDEGKQPVIKIEMAGFLNPAKVTFTKATQLAPFSASPKNSDQ